MKALLVIDMQKDFVPGGALAVPHGDLLVPVINQYISDFSLVIGTQDWHPADHKSFASQHAGHQPFDEIEWMGGQQTLWPDHCVQGEIGAEFCSGLNSDAMEVIFRKGMNADIDSYSAFYDNQHLKSTGLAGYLHGQGVNELYFSGLCADICVYYSILDALEAGFTCYLYESATCALNQDDWLIKRKHLISLGVRMV